MKVTMVKTGLNIEASDTYAARLIEQGTAVPAEVKGSPAPDAGEAMPAPAKDGEGQEKAPRGNRRGGDAKGQDQ